MMRTHGISALLVSIFWHLLCCFGGGSADGSDAFPLRKKYPQLQPINTHELSEARAAGKAVVIDVRTKAEFDVLHIEGAINISHMLGPEDFHAIEEAKNPADGYLVFYCNGVLCSKSYKAAELALQRGLVGVRNYDEGIFRWAEVHPEQAIFFGERLTAANAKERLISNDEFSKALVETVPFIDMARSGKYHVYDVREQRERAEYHVDLPYMKTATLDEMSQLLRDGKFPRSNVLLLDNVGRQVIWAQYHLRSFGVTNYFFLAGGVAKWRADGKNSKGDDLGKVFGHSKKTLLKDLRDRAGVKSGADE